MQPSLRNNFAAVISSPLGLLGTKLDTDGGLMTIEFLTNKTPLLDPKTSAAERVVRQLDDYFSNPQFHFDLPIAPAPTPFQSRLRLALCAIPCGSTRSYGELARELQSAPRAIGQACRRNPIPIVVPCHRVVAAVGLGGYAGQTSGTLLDIKCRLLTLEQGSELDMGLSSPHVPDISMT